MKRMALIFDKTTETSEIKKWDVREFKDIKKGDIFRVQEPDGTFAELEGQSHSVADCDAYFDDSRGYWCVDATFTLIVDATLEKVDNAQA